MDDLSQVLMNGDVLQIGKKRFLQFNKYDKQKEQSPRRLLFLSEF